MRGMENLITCILENYPKSKQIKQHANSLKNGFSLNSSKDLENICLLSYWLYILENNMELSLKVCKIVQEETFDGNYNKWTWLEGIYQLCAYLTKENERNFYIKKLKSPVEILNEDKKISLYKKTVERRLNDTSLYFKEIQTAIEKKDVGSEMNWRQLIQAPVLAGGKYH
jgi:hypothetical protein